MIADPRSHVPISALTDKPESASIVSEWADVLTASNIYLVLLGAPIF
jgi:hypothetical protein